MRIAIIFPVSDKPATRAYAVWLRSVHRLYNELMNRDGVEITPIPIHDAGPYASFKLGVVGVEPSQKLAHVFEHANQFDLIHDMIGFASLTYASLVSTPVLSTVWHESWDAAPHLFEHHNNRVYYLAPSDQDRKTGISYTETVDWGVEIPSTSSSCASPCVPDNHIVYLGPLHPNPGLQTALEFADKTNRPICLFGSPADQPLFEQQLSSRDGSPVRHYADPASDEADVMIAKAAAVVHAGCSLGMQRLCLMEASGRGVPIIAIGDSQIDYVKDGIIGFHFRSVDSAVAALDKILAINRTECRNSAIENFGIINRIPMLLDVYKRTIDHAKREDHRPWGYYNVLSDERTHKVKRLVVYPGKRLSLQRHRRRSEHWFVVEGEAMAVQDEDEVRLFPGQSIEIPIGCWHRLRNPGGENLTIIEVQTGEYFGEDDIERMEDDYGRVPDGSCIR